jgi:RNA polymerase sigma-70 factor (ECF subfamily)
MTRQEFAVAYAETFRLTRAFLRSRGLEPSEAEEIAQAAWTKAWERCGQLRNRASLAAWVNTIALNVFRSRWHKRSQLELLDRDKAVRPAYDRKLDAAKALRAMDKEDQRLWLLHAVSGMTSSEISERSRLTPVAVRVRLHRAMDRLRTRFGPRAERRCSRPSEERNGAGKSF